MLGELILLKGISDVFKVFREKSLAAGLFLILFSASVEKLQSQTASANAQVDAANSQREAVLNAMTVSTNRQKTSVRRQKAMATASGGASSADGDDSHFFVTDALIAPVEVQPFCDRLPPMQLEPLIARAAKANQVSADLVRAVMEQESAFRACAVSAKGAMGLMQLMPGTAEDLGVADAFDPEENAFAGAKLLHSLMTRYRGDLIRVLGAYNAGPASVDAAGGLPDFPETKGYIDKITQALGISPVLQ